MVPRIAVLRGDLASEPEMWRASARYKVCEVLLSEVPLAKGDTITVELPVPCYGLELRWHAMADRDCPPWPHQGFFLLVAKDNGTDTGTPVFLPVTGRWDKWILPVSEANGVRVRSLAFEELRREYRRYQFLLTRGEAARAGCPYRHPILLPIGDNDDSFPVIAVLHRAGLHKALIVSVWADGRVVWSRDVISGGPPYQEGFISKAEITAFLRTAKVKGILGGKGAQKLPADDGVVLDGAVHTLSIHSAEGSLQLSTSRELCPTEPFPPSDVRFSSAWATLREGIARLIPASGNALPLYEYQVLPVDAR